MKKLGIGYENYKEFIDGNMYYVDKTLLIRDILDKGGKVTLFTRPRRFGKTLALSMLRTFFEAEYDREGNAIDKSRYFEGMKIMDAGGEVLAKMGQYPVIKLSLKSAKQPDFYGAFMKLREEIIDEFSRHYYLSSSANISEETKKDFLELLKGKSIWSEKERKFSSNEEKSEGFREEVSKYATALKTLSTCLKLHHGKNVVVLLDEYDVPLENAYYSGFYTEMVGFIRSLFESVLKTNDALELAVITGCLRISKESIFTGLNNLQTDSVRGRDFGEYFGFTQEETEEMLKAYDLSDNVDIVRDWYDGYLFGEANVYNPWSVIMYISQHRGAPERLAEPYWSNTSSNSVIRDMINRADDETKNELESLIEGGTIEKQIHEDITYEDIDKSADNLWNFLFFTGYLREVSERPDGDDILAALRIPNREIRSIYSNHIKGWFDKTIKSLDNTAFHTAVLQRDTEGMKDILSALLKKSISTFDSLESFYHGYLLSMLTGIKDYTAKSNREEGDGRPDIVLFPDNPEDPAYIFEIKVRKRYSEMQNGLEEALTQIRQKKYEDGILDDGYIGAVSYGLCFCRKACIVGCVDQSQNHPLIEEGRPANGF